MSGIPGANITIIIIGFSNSNIEKPQMMTWQCEAPEEMPIFFLPS
jgi:hypothetical protein